MWFLIIVTLLLISLFFYGKLFQGNPIKSGEIAQLSVRRSLIFLWKSLRISADGEIVLWIVQYHLLQL
jgi:hypothetical protein